MTLASQWRKFVVYLSVVRLRRYARYGSVGLIGGRVVLNPTKRARKGRLDMFVTASLDVVMIETGANQVSKRIFCALSIPSKSGLTDRQILCRYQKKSVNQIYSRESLYAYRKDGVPEGVGCTNHQQNDQRRHG